MSLQEKVSLVNAGNDEPEDMAVEEGVQVGYTQYL